MDGSSPRTESEDRGLALVHSRTRIYPRILAARQTDPNQYGAIINTRFALSAEARI
jgi:hypothetical protein